MILSGLLMYGTAQRKRIIGYGFMAVLAIYLFVGSLSLPFFVVNIATIFILSQLLKRVKLQVIKSTSILIYSVIIDIICFFVFPQFTIASSLGAYILAGLAFNLRSAIPAIVVGLAVSVVMVVRAARKPNTQLVTLNAQLLAN